MDCRLFSSILHIPTRYPLALTTRKAKCFLQGEKQPLVKNHYLKVLNFRETNTRSKVPECFPPVCLMSPEILNSEQPPCVMGQGKTEGNLVEGEHRLIFPNSIPSPEHSISALLRVNWWLIKNAESSAAPHTC